jgi:hypothetical protein
MRSSTGGPVFAPGTEQQRTFRLQSGSPRARPGPGRSLTKPDLGIFVPPFSTTIGSANLSSTVSTASSSPVRRKPVPGSATSQLQSRSRISSVSSAGTGIYPPRSSSLQSPTFSPKVRSHTISTPGLAAPDTELFVRDLDQ